MRAVVLEGLVEAFVGRAAALLWFSVWGRGRRRLTRSRSARMRGPRVCVKNSAAFSSGWRMSSGTGCILLSLVLFRPDIFAGLRPPKGLGVGW